MVLVNFVALVGLGVEVMLALGVGFVIFVALVVLVGKVMLPWGMEVVNFVALVCLGVDVMLLDRKSTRLNSKHW